MANKAEKNKIAILGFGQEGKSILKFLKKDSQFKNSDISILDKRTDKNYLKQLINFNKVFRSPGVPYNLKEIQDATKKGVRFSSATNLFFERANKIGCKIIGITGTKGKGTTSTLLYKILKAVKKDVYLAGNIGKPAIDVLPKLKKSSIVILELSSFQLQDLRYSPDIAVVLNIFEDHMDSHKDFKEYLEAKSQIAKYQNKNSKIFYDATNKYAANIARLSKGEKIPILTENFNLFNQGNLKIVGTHNFKNAAIAATVAKHLRIDSDIIKKTVKNYTGLEHRLEFVKNIGNVKFYNDSASTNPYTTIAAIKSFNEPKILIAGGKDKNLDYSPLAKALKNSNTKLIILFGENKNKIYKAIRDQKIVIRKIKNLKDAVDLAYKTAESLLSTSPYSLITILFSPASASFDMFNDYKDRGNKFKELVNSLDK